MRLLNNLHPLDPATTSLLRAYMSLVVVATALMLVLVPVTVLQMDMANI